MRTTVLIIAAVLAASWLWLAGKSNQEDDDGNTV